MRSLARKLLFAVLLPSVLLLMWEVIAVKVANPTILPTVGKVILRLLHPFSNVLGTGSLISNIMISGFRVLCGFSVAVVIGVPLGMIMASVVPVRKLLSPVIEILRPLCPIAWIPFALAVFRTYTIPNIFQVRYTNTILDHLQLGMLFIIFWGGFFPVLINTIYGVASIKDTYIESALTLGATRTQIFKKIILPAALPSIFTGVRVGLGISWMVIIAAEMLPGSDSGIGYLIMYAYSLAEMDLIVTGMILIGIVAAILSKTVKIIADRTSGWQAKEH